MVFQSLLTKDTGTYGSHLDEDFRGVAAKI